MAGAQLSRLSILTSILCGSRLLALRLAQPRGALGKGGWKNANSTLSESSQLLPSPSESLGRRAGTAAPRMPQAVFGPAENVISATILIPSLALRFFNLQGALMSTLSWGFQRPWIVTADGVKRSTEAKVRKVVTQGRRASGW